MVDLNNENYQLTHRPGSQDAFASKNSALVQCEPFESIQQPHLETFGLVVKLRLMKISTFRLLFRHFSQRQEVLRSFGQVQLLVSDSDVKSYKQIKDDLDDLRLLVEKSELWVYKAVKLEDKKVSLKINCCQISICKIQITCQTRSKTTFFGKARQLIN